MGFARFMFVAGIKTLGLLFLGLLASKAVGALQNSPSPIRRSSAIQWCLYALILTLVGLGALTVGYDVAAETYLRASARDLARQDRDHALINAQ